MVVAVFYLQNTVAPNQISRDDVHPMWLADENQSTHNLSVTMKVMSPLRWLQSTFEYYTIYSQVVLIPAMSQHQIYLNISEFYILKKVV